MCCKLSFLNLKMSSNKKRLNIIQNIPFLFCQKGLMEKGDHAFKFEFRVPSLRKTKVCDVCVSLSVTVVISSWTASISLASLVRYWHRSSSCWRAMAIRRDRLCMQLMTERSALACVVPRGTGEIMKRYVATHQMWECRSRRKSKFDWLVASCDVGLCASQKQRSNGP